jgi:hypothetical protein
MRVFAVVAQIRRIAWSTFIPHSRTVRSSLPLARVCPSGLNATVSTPSAWPVSQVDQGRGKLWGRPHAVGGEVELGREGDV